MSRFKPKAEKLLPKEQVKEEPKSTSEPAKTEPIVGSQLYQTVKVHIDALGAKGEKAPKISPSMNEQKLQKILDEIHALKIL